ncbi:MAG: hypothetical protein JRF40_11030, partial [Deltaproteobacteria bacterium]|nr:hypothetical protein [Deltaproteobacteria bacterium]
HIMVQGYNSFSGVTLLGPYTPPPVPNIPPTADAGPDQSVGENVIVTLDGTGSSDPEDGTIGSTYDLDQWNDAFWTRLDNFYKETQQRGIIVQSELWDPFSFQFEGWDMSPWNPKNNLNYDSAESGLPITWYEHHSEIDSPFVLTVPGLPNDQNGADVLGYQEKFIQKILDIGKPYDHIIYQIQNES